MTSQEREKRARVWLENQGLLVIYGDVQALVKLLADTEAATYQRVEQEMATTPGNHMLTGWMQWLRQQAQAAKEGR